MPRPVPVASRVTIDDATTEPWEPMIRRVPNPEAMRISNQIGGSFHEAWSNNVYDCQVHYLNEERGKAGSLHISFKRHDRTPVRDWRHIQAIKNEVAGWEREALELFPAESRLVDGANQTHLWLPPTGVSIAVGFTRRAVATHEEMEAELRSRGLEPKKGRQRSWQRNLSTGPNYRP